jgi:hypothetical protein
MADGFDGHWACRLAVKIRSLASTVPQTLLVAADGLIE